MKNSIQRTSATLGIVIALAATLSQAASGQTTVSYDWRFSSDAAQVVPKTSTGGSGAPLATVAPGGFASGWMAQNGALGNAQGIWDLGRNGRITLSNSAGLAGSSAQARQVTITVEQYQDGSIYDQLAQVSLPGATLVSSTGTYSAGTTLGGWMTHVTQWNVPAGVAADSVVISGAYNGSLVDHVVVESTAVVVAAPTLSIQSVGAAQVQVSWAAASGTNWVLEATSDLSSWTPVDAQVQVSGATASVTTEAAGAVRFYRLKQP